MGNKLKLVAVSHSCVKAINRAVYREMSKLNWDINLVVPEVWSNGGYSIEAESAIDGDPPLRLLNLVGTNPRTYLFTGFDRLLDELQPDVVFLECDPISRLVIQTAAYGHRAGAKYKTVCLSCENLSIRPGCVLQREGVRGLPKSLIKCWMARRSRRLVDHVFAISSDGLQLFQDLGFRSVSKIPLGFDRTYFKVDPAARNDLREQLGLSSTVIAYFGRITPEKGIHHLLDSLGKLKHLPWHLMLDQFEGHNSDYAQGLHRQIDELAIRDRICFIESKHGEIARFMNAADVVVIPSIATQKWKEQYGRVAPEAMACGKLVIAYDSGALPELVGDRGIIVPEGNIEELTGWLAKILRGEVDFSTYQQYASEYAATNLSTQSQALQMDNVFRGLIGT